MENKQRIRTSVPITGIDTSTPDHSVIDGKCEVLHNLRYTGEAWRNVKQFSESEELPDLGGKTIIYHHPADVDNAYITYDAETKNGVTTYTFYRSEYGYFFNEWSWRHTEGGLLTIKDADSLDIEELVQVGHFGKMLIIGHNPSKTFHFFFLSTSNSGAIYYTKTEIDKADFDLSLSIPDTSDYENNLKISNIVDYTGNAARCTVGGADGKLSFDKKLRETDYNGAYKHFRGEFLMVATLVSEEGEIIKVSPFRLFNSAIEVEQKFDDSNTTRQRAYKYQNGTNAFIATPGNSSQSMPDRYKKWPGSFFFCEAEATIKVSNINEGTRVAYIDIYTTSLQNLIEYKTISYWGDNTIDLFQEPLHRVKRISIADLQGEEEYKFTVDSTMFDNIESGVEFTAVQTAADLYGSIAVEYNNRLHLTNVYTKLNYDNLHDYISNASGADVGYSNFLARVSYDGEKIWSKTTIDRVSLSSARYFVCNGNLTNAYFSNDTDSRKYAMRNAALYNISYTYQYSDVISNEDTHYKVGASLDLSGNSNAYLASKKYLLLSESGVEEAMPVVATDQLFSEIRTPNAVRVSAANIPYSFPYENSYRVGSGASKIISINSVAIEMSDSKFGEFPLYVFTNEGVWAMQSGTETLYSAIITLNYDVIINPNTLAVNNSILYFTDKGINALSRDGSKQISSPIHTKENRIPKWMYESKMVYLPEWNEVMCVDFTGRTIYILSLDNGVWSTRDIPQGYIINNGELISTDSKIYNLRDEVEAIENNRTAVKKSNLAMRSTVATKYQWVSDWGVLKTSGDEDRKVTFYKYDEVSEEVTFRKLYVYRPSQPNFSLTQFNFKATVRAKIDPNFNPKDLIFIIPEDEMVFASGESPFGIGAYPEDPKFSTVNVYLPDGRLLTTLKNKPNPDNNIYIDTRYFYDTNTPVLGIDPDYYGVAFDPWCFGKSDDGTERYQIYPYGYFHPYYPDGDPDSLVTPDDDMVWKDVYNWFNTYYANDDRIFVMTDISFSKDDSSLYYAFDEPLSLNSTDDPFVVCIYNNGSGDTAYRCTQTDEDENENPFDDHISIIEVDGDDEDLGGDDPGDDNGGNEGGDNTGGDNGGTGGGDTGGDNGGDNGGSGGDDSTGDVPTYNPTNIHLKTRPIKLGTGKELKRLETLVLRFEADKEEVLKVAIKGSIDGVKFFTLREVKPTTNKDILIRRVPCSVKYLSFEVEGVNITSDIRIIGFDTEHYTRFERRLR